MRQFRSFLSITALAGLTLSGCSVPDTQPATAARAAPPPGSLDLVPLGQDRYRPRARAGGAGQDRAGLGSTIVSLGDPSQAGLWLKTPLVRTEQPGQISHSTRRTRAKLIPIQGPANAGSRMSLDAYHALGLSPAGLYEIEVFLK